MLGAILYQMGFVHSFEVAWRGVWNADTISVIVITYLITFLQRMMEQKGDLLLAQRSLSGIFNSRRVNASVAPIFIGLLPSPAAAFIAGSKRSFASLAGIVRWVFQIFLQASALQIFQRQILTSIFPENLFFLYQPRDFSGCFKKILLPCPAFLSYRPL